MIGLTTSTSPWNTFEDVREHLFHQFTSTPFDASSGLPLEELEGEIEGFLAAHPEMPRVLQKAHVYRLVVTRAQIAVDPLDWFVDKLNHGGLIDRLNRRWLAEAQAGPLKEESAWFRMLWQRGIGRGLLDTGHISPGWENMFAGGLSRPAGPGPGGLRGPG